MHFRVLMSFAAVVLAALGAAAPTVPKFFGSHMVLQRGAKTPVWGWADPGERIDVSFRDQKITTFTDSTGAWRVELKNLVAGGPDDLVIKGKETLVLSDVLVGEVWLASGQSNMEWSKWHFAYYKRDVQLGKTDVPKLRLFRVEHAAKAEPQTDVVGSWLVCNEKNLEQFSMVGFYFGRRLVTELDVPVGIVGTHWGGTTAEAWTRVNSLDGHPWTKPIADHYRAIVAEYPAKQADYLSKLKTWQTTVLPADTGNTGVSQGWAQPEHPETDWQTMTLPRAWDEPLDGAVWFRRELVLTDAQASLPATLELGSIDDFDTTYLNGQQVGAIGRDVFNAVAVQRAYQIPAGVLKPGRNVIAVRVFDWVGGGGLIGPRLQLRLMDTTIDLSGAWKWKVERAVKTVTAEDMRGAPVAPLGPNSAAAAGNLWNGMVQPLVGLSFRGVIWYQGESNAARAEQYSVLFPLMIKDWRMAWGRGDFPFYYVQLANFMARKPNPEESAWAELREAQTSAMRVRNTGMAVAIDVGEAGDIHPINKEVVGERLALWALAKDYGKSIPFSGPLYRGYKKSGSEIRVQFDYAFGGLATLSGMPLTGFSIAGSDRRFVWANARVDGNEVVVWSDQVRDPVAVRYAWADNPACNLINKAGLPASPFRTDDWPGVTTGKR